HVITLFAQARGVILSPIPTDMHLFLLQLFNGLAWGLGYLGMPHIVVNYMGINNPNHIQRAKYVGMTWLVISLTAAIAIGYIAIGYFPALINSELVFVNLVQELYNPFVGGIILCAILAATMSTIDTQILVASTALAHDVLPKLLTLRS